MDCKVSFFNYLLYVIHNIKFTILVILTVQFVALSAVTWVYNPQRPFLMGPTSTVVTG